MDRLADVDVRRPQRHACCERSRGRTFIGWGPVDDPQFMVYVWLQSPSSSIWSSETAAPVFEQVAEQTVITLNIPPDVVRSQLQATGQ